MSKFLRLTTLWLYGGFIYYVIELIWRGYSYDQMFVVGGLCFLLLGVINNYLPWEMGLLWQALIGAGIITIVEFISGVILNIWLKLNIWDYTGTPLNLLGQICLPYFFAWIGLSVFGIFVDDYLRWKLYGEDKPGYKIL